MSFIAVCGGGGKTTICEKYPDLFVDLDSFIWSDTNKDYHDQLQECVWHGNTDAIGAIYKTIMTERGHEIVDDRIVLGHHPINATWLNITHIYSIKPNKQMHEHNIRHRDVHLQQVARHCWDNLSDAVIYHSYAEFERLMLFMTPRQTGRTGSGREGL